MTFKEAIIKCLHNYATFKGRATRSEYWWFLLFNVLLNVGCNIIDRSGALAGVEALVLILPMLAVATRRLHDIDKSGWYQLIGFIPLIGAFVLIFWFCQPGTPGINRFDEASITPV